MSNFYIISKSYDPGSASTNHALALIRGFDELGVKAKWVFIFPNQECDKCDIIFKNISVIHLWKDRLGHRKILRQIYKHISYARFFYSLKQGDTVLLLGAKVYLRKLSQKKNINVFHELTEHPAIGRLSRLPIFTCKMYVEWCKKVNGLFVITNTLKNYFISQGINPDIIHVINMVVDNNRFNNVKKQHVDKPYIVYCGNASNTKDGVDDLIKAFAIVSKKHDNYILKIIGPKPFENTINFNLVQELNIENKVDFVGCVLPSEIPQLLVNADIVALCRPSSLQNTYGFPTKLGEYLLSGNPVCVTAVGDIPLFLSHKDTALLSKCGDYIAFAKNLEWCIEHPDESKEIGQRGKKVALDNFNYLIESRKIINVIFKELL